MITNVPISVLTYNLLIQKHLDPDTYATYLGIDKSVFEWEYRLNLIHSQIDNANPNICCFQEVTLKQFEQDFAKYFSIYKYKIHEINKNRTSDIGNVVMWKNELFELDEKKPKPTSSAIIVKLIHKLSGKKFILCNTHLKCHETGKEEACEKTRVNQLSSSIKKIKEISQSDPICICGDFNDFLLDDSKLRNLIQLNNFTIAKSQKTFYSYKTGEYYSYDQVCWFGLDVKVETIPKLYPIPSENDPSDHFPIFFTIQL